MSVTILLSVEVTEHEVLPRVSVSSGPPDYYDSKGMRVISDNTLLANRQGLGVYKKVIDFAEDIEDK